MNVLSFPDETRSDSPRPAKRIYAGAALCLLLLVPAGNVFAQGQSLLELYLLAKAKHPDIIRAEARLEGGKAEKGMAVAALLPRVNANASTRQFWTEVRDYDPAGPIKGEYTGYGYGVSAGVPLLNLPSVYQLAAADAGIDSAESGVQAARQDLIVRLLEAYIGCLKSYADEKLYRDELGRVGKVLEQAEAYLKAGTGDIIAVYEARARLDSAAADLVKAEGQIQLARQKLASLTGITVESVRDIALPADKGPEMQHELEWWIDTMRQRNPSLTDARLVLKQAEEISRAVYAGHYPTISANGGYTADKGSTFLPDVLTKQWYIGASLTIPIYSGGDTTARTRRALAGESEQRAALHETEEKAISRLKESYLKLRHSMSMLDAYRRKHESADMQLKAVQKGREIGTRTAIDMLNSEQTYAVSLRDMASARYDVVLMQIELKAAAGILGEEDLAAVNGQDRLAGNR